MTIDQRLKVSILLSFIALVRIQLLAHVLHNFLNADTFSTFENCWLKANIANSRCLVVHALQQILLQTLEISETDV